MKNKYYIALLPSDQANNWFQNVLWYGNEGLCLESKPLEQLHMTCKAPFWFLESKEKMLSEIVKELAITFKVFNTKVTMFNYFPETDDLFLEIDRNEDVLVLRRKTCEMLKFDPSITFSQYDPEGVLHISLFDCIPNRNAENYCKLLNEKFVEKPLIVFDELCLIKKVGNIRQKVICLKLKTG
jgi:hypothetical protein